MSARSRTALAVLVITGIGIALRVANGGFSYWYNPDEALHWSIANSRSLSELYRLSTGQAHPPGFFILVRAFQRIQGGLDWLRFPFLVAGALLPGLVSLAGGSAGIPQL